MNILSTTTSSAATKLKQVAPSIQKTEAPESLTDNVFDLVDKVSVAGRRVANGTLLGALGAFPFVGLGQAKLLREIGGEGRATEVFNTTTAVAQLAGLATGALTLGSAITGLGNAGAIGTVAGCCFGLSGLSTFATAMVCDETALPF